MNVINVALQMCAPREVVLQQMWREEEDGTFIVLLHSTKHRRAATPPASWSWWQPIRAQVCPLACPSACPLPWLSSSLLFRSSDLAVDFFLQQIDSCIDSCLSV